MKKFKLLFIALLISLILAACGGGNDESSEGAEEGINPDKIVVGVTDGPHAQVLEKVKELAAEEGLEIEIKSFSDYVLPNTALAEGDLDANSYQHLPFLEQFNEDKGTNLVSVAETMLFPITIYSDKYEDINDIPEGATYGLPNDPTNEARALQLLADNDLITIEEGKEDTATPHDVVDNPKNIEFVELDASQIPNQLSEVDFAAINTNFAVSSGVYKRDDVHVLYQESTENNPYNNIIAVRDENKDDPTIKKFVEIYQSEEVKKFIEEELEGGIVPAF